VKDIYKIHYVDLLGNIDDDRTNTDFNESDPTNYMTVIRNECIKCIALLDSELEHDLYPDLVELLKKWDKVYDLNAIDLYPELSELLLEYNYNVD
jgi:hypothetical protein